MFVFLSGPVDVTTAPELTPEQGSNQTELNILPANKCSAVVQMVQMNSYI